MNILIFGAGNLLLSDEGFGVHFIRHLESSYCFPENVSLLDAGTLGIMVTHELEQADCVYMIDVVAASGEPGQIFRYTKPDIMLKRIPVKLSPHQIGVQEMLLVSEMRGRCPDEIILLGVVPASLEPGSSLSPVLHNALTTLSGQLISELQQRGVAVKAASERFTGISK